MNGTARRGDFIHTFSGRQQWPLDPRPGDFDIEEIAHALACSNRFNGHTKFPISIAQHSLLVVQLTHPFWRREALMHDAPEAIIGDVVTPLKRVAGMADFRGIEAAIWSAMAKQWGLVEDLPRDVHWADLQALVTEASQLHNEPTYGPRWWDAACYPRPAAIEIEEWTWRRAEKEFLEAFGRLFPEQVQG